MPQLKFQPASPGQAVVVPIKPLLLIALGVWTGCSAHATQTIPSLPEVPTFPVNNGPVDVKNSFNKHDPSYKQRAGTFYETEYLGFSAAKLFKLIDLDFAKRVGALDILRGFIYEWLDFCVRDNGRISAEHCAAAVKSMDNKFQRLLSPLQFKIYQVWRDDDTGEVNRLHFLIHYDAKAVAERDKEAGVTVGE